MGQRSRRTKAEMTDIRDGLYEIVEADHPMTCRQIFYQATTRGLVPKTEGAYQSTVLRLLLEMRREGVVPYDWIADGTRWQRKPVTYTGLEAFIERHARTYRRDLWAEANTYVEIWCEKEALAGVLVDVTAEFDVPLMVSRGFSSESFLYNSAEMIEDQVYGDADKDGATIYYFGDYDPSGLKISGSIETGIRRILDSQFCWRGSTQDRLTFERVAVTTEQIAQWSLPTRPTKIKGNSHAKGWDEDEGSVELDAIPANQLRELVRGCIEDHVDQDQLAHLRQVEEEERQQLVMFGKQLAA
jgi:hypothetical protein